MLNRLATATAALAVLGASSVCAQPAPPDRPEGTRPPAVSREDAGAYLEARISALHSGLQLTPEQERLWPAFEQAYRESAKLRLERRSEPPAADDLVARMQRRADALTRRAAAAKALAEAAAPLWQSFGDGQKRRFAMLARPSGFGARDERGGFGGDRNRYDFGRGPGDFGSGGPGRDGDFGPRRFGGPGRNGDYGRGDGDGNGFRGQRGFEPRGFGGPRRDGDYGYGERRGFGPGRDRDYGYGFERRGFGRDDDYGYGGRRGFGPGRDRDYGYGERRGFERRGFGRGDDYGYGERPGFGPGRPGRGDGRDFGRDFGGAYDRGRLPWWHPDVGPRRGGPGGRFRTLDDPGPGERSGADEKI
jgi:hypothetical protein